MKSNNTILNTSVALFFLLFFCNGYSQNTLQIIKFEEAQEMFNSNKFKEAVTILTDLENKGLKNPKVLHLKILAKSNYNKQDITEEVLSGLKSDVNKYLKDYDIQGLEDKFKEVYQVSKKLISIESFLVKNKADDFFKNKDYNKALTLYLKSNEMGYEELDLYLPIIDIYKELSKTTSSYKKDVIKWKEKVADLGDIPSCIEIAFIYKEGKEVPQDPVKAAKYFRKAEGSNLPGANFGIGWLYMFAVDVEYDYYAAKEMFLLELKNSKYYCESYFQILNRNDRNELYYYIINSSPSNHNDYYCRERMALIYCKFRSDKKLVEESINSLKVGADQFNSPLAQLYLHNVYNGIFEVKGIKVNNELAEKYLTDFNNNPNKIDTPYIHFLIASHYNHIDKIGIYFANPYSKELYNKYDLAIKSGSFEAIQTMIRDRNNPNAKKLLNENNIIYK